MWQQFTKLSGPVGSSALDDVLNSMAAGNDEFVTPQAAVTRVLVAGATGRCAPQTAEKLEKALVALFETLWARG